jgi:valyl-tRNA synthetase
MSQDPDVLDTWFSSALWPLSTMGWPDPEQAAKETGLADMPSMIPAFNPTSTLCTAREIITLWVSRMVMFNRYLRAHEREGSGEHAPIPRSPTPAGASAGPVPFRHVYIHAVVQDGEGRKMSKSLGNGVDPLDIIATHGADAMRFTVCQMATQTQDVRLPVKKDAQGRNTSEKFDLGRNFANKLWNAARFAMGILGTDAGTNGIGGATGTSTPVKATTLADRWLLSRLSAAVAACDAALAEYQFSNYAQIVYDLLWRDFCDWYLEAIKPTVATNSSQRAVLRSAIESIVRLLHPVMPFVTEAIYEKLSLIPLTPVEGVTLSPPTKGAGGGLLATAGWPIVSEKLGDPDAEAQFNRLREIIDKVREVRAERKIAPKHKVVLHLPSGKDKPLGGEFGGGGKGTTEEALVLIQTLAGVETITTHAPGPDAGPVATFMFEGAEHRVSKLVDPAAAAGDAGDAKAAEIDRIKKLIAGLQKEVATLQGRLANPGYTAKAPPHMVEETKQLLSKKEGDLVAAEAQLKAIG